MQSQINQLQILLGQSLLIVTFNPGSLQIQFFNEANQMHKLYGLFDLETEQQLRPFRSGSQLYELVKDGKNYGFEPKKGIFRMEWKLVADGFSRTDRCTLVLKKKDTTKEERLEFEVRMIRSRLTKYGHLEGLQLKGEQMKVNRKKDCKSEQKEKDDKKDQRVSEVDLGLEVKQEEPEPKPKVSQFRIEMQKEKTPSLQPEKKKRRHESGVKPIKRSSPEFKTPKSSSSEEEMSSEEQFTSLDPQVSLLRTRNKKKKKANGEQKQFVNKRQKMQRKKQVKWQTGGLKLVETGFGSHQNSRFRKTTFGDKIRIDYENGDFYFGELKNNMYNGVGKCSSEMGKYDGDWKDGLRHGYGEYLDNDGNKYLGYFKDDMRDGKGKETFANGDKYEGDYKQDFRHGKGTYYFINGDRYEGGWKKDLWDGQGREIFADGSVYEGVWSKDERNGPGTYSSKKEALSQVWANGKKIQEVAIKSTAKK